MTIFVFVREMKSLYLYHPSLIIPGVDKTGGIERTTIRQSARRYPLMTTTRVCSTHTVGRPRATPEEIAILIRPSTE